jgi:hypothetical protein
MLDLPDEREMVLRVLQNERKRNAGHDIDDGFLRERVRDIEEITALGRVAVCVKQVLPVGVRVPLPVVVEGAEDE